MANNVTNFFYNFILRRSQQLFRFENGVIQQLIASLNKAKEGMRAKLLLLEGTLIGPRAGVFSRTFLINRLNVQITGVQILLNNLALEQTSIMQTNMVDLSVNEANAVTQMLQSQYGKLGKNITTIAFPQIDFMMGTNLLGQQLQSSFLFMNQQATNLMREELLQSFIQGEDIRQATNRLIGAGKNLGGSVGRLMVNRAEMIARSELQFVSAQVSRRIYGENTDVLKGVVWSSTLDRRTCLRCASLDGNYYKLDPESGAHNGPIIVLHPRCRCVYVPITKSWQELGHVTQRSLNKREKEFFSSSRPPIETYDMWLKRQSTAIQKDVLGPTRFKAWKQGKLKLTQMATDKKIKTIKQLGLDTVKTIAEFDTNLV